MHNNIPEQNQPINVENAVSMSWFKWIVGCLTAAAIIAFGFMYHFIDKVEDRLKGSISVIENKYQSDHDKIIRLETKIESKK